MVWIFRRAVFPALALSICLAGAGRAVATDCRLEAYGEVTVTPGKGDRSLFPITVDGRVLQAAFEPTSMQSLTQRAIPHTLDKVPQYGRLIDSVMFDQIVLGKLRIASPTVGIADLEPGVDVDLGQDVLRIVDLELDLSKDKIRFFSPDHCADQTVYWAKEHYEFDYQDTIYGGQFEAIVNGQAIRAVLSPSSLRTVIDVTRLSDLGLAKGGDGKVEVDTLEFGGIHLRHRKLDALTVAHLGNVLGPHNPAGSAADTPTILIGADVLKHLRVFVANQEHKVYFTVADN
jgi:hypothetical protein